ncbi:MAG: GAF domain-containing protein, partial [Elusimicrobiota bacterium]
MNRGVLLVVAGICLSVFAGVGFHIHNAYRNELHYWRNRQASIMADRARSVERWLSHEASLARAVAYTPILRSGILSGAAGREPVRELLDRIERHFPGGILCLNLPGGERMSSRRSNKHVCPAAGAQVIGVLDDVTLRLQGTTPSDTLVGFSVEPRLGPGGRQRARLTRWVSINETLLPELAAEDVPSRTGETMLVFREEGGDLVYLNTARGRLPTAPHLRWPKHAQFIAASEAVDGRRTFGTFQDYRGHETLATTGRVDSIGWGLVRKIDREEALAGFRREAGLELAASAFLVSALCGLLWAFWQRRRFAWLTERLADAARISRLNRVLAVLSGVNEVIVRERKRPELLDAICRTAVEQGGFPLVWVGFLGGADGRLIPEAWAGPAAGHGIRPKTDFRPFVTDEPCVCRDLSSWGPCPPGGAGMRSCGVFPLAMGGRKAGAVIFYSSIPDFFDKEEVRLLEQLSRDLSYALENIETEAQAARTAAELEVQRERLDTVTMNLGIGLAIISRDLRVVWANDVMRRLEGDLMDRLCQPGDDRGPGEELACAAEKVFAGAERVEVERMGLGPDGTPRWTQVIASPLKGPGGEVSAVLQAVVPITERKLLEEQLRQSQKLEAVGRIAGGMAHDFNNILTAIMGYAELIEAGAGTEPKRREYAGQIVRSASVAAALTGQLLAFSRRQVMSLRVIDLNDAVLEAGDMLRRLLGEKVRLVTKLETSLGLVKADPVQLEQILVNLAVNARDAMPQG